MSPAAKRHEVTIDGRTLSLSNLDKVMYPATGFTKAEVVDYYARIAPVMLPHLAGRPITLVRWPDGVDGNHFFEKNCPKHRPPWIPTVEMTVSEKTHVKFCRLDEPAALAWTANMAALELHPGLATEADLRRPTWVVFDLDPGPPATAVECAQVALWLREVFDGLGLTAGVKTSGSKGLQVYVPLHTGVTYDETSTFSLAIAQLLEKWHPKEIVTVQTKELRAGKVLIDWSQNSYHKTTVGVYSLRAREKPTVSTPITWAEVEALHESADPESVRFVAGAVLQRIEEHGDLWAGLLHTEQKLPSVGG